MEEESRNYLGGAVLVIFIVGLFVVDPVGRARLRAEDLAPAEKPASDAIELPLDSLTYSNPKDDSVSLFLIWNSEEGTTTSHYAALSGITVEMRQDKQEYTSVRLSEKHDGRYSYYDKMVLLVPVEEDVETWSKEIEKYRKMRAEYLEARKRKPRRVLPSGQ